MEPFVPRALVIKPRRRGYVHRDIIVIRERLGFTEHGEVISDIIDFAMREPSHIFATGDPADLLNTMLLSHAPDFNATFMDSREADLPDDYPTHMSNPRVVRFGWGKAKGTTGKGKRKGKAMHMVWSLADMMRDNLDVLGGGTVQDIMKFAVDVRDFCKDNNIPLATSLGGIAASMLKDPRFWPNPRGRVPRATNERVRPYLPGVHQDLRAPVFKMITSAVAIDQRRAYHKAAQAVPIPDGTTLFARGYYNMPEDPTVWQRPGSTVYNRIMSQPGIVYIRATSRYTHKNEVRPNAIDYVGTRNILLWTNELPLCLSTDLQVEGLIAAWTSNLVDTGLPLYGAWAENAINNADEDRARWLKPTLHAAYGMLGARARDLHIAHLKGRAKVTTYLIGGHGYLVHEHVLPNQAPATTNTAALGTLQAAIRTNTMEMANNLISEGVDVLHIHADGIHIKGKLPPLNTNEWSIEPRTNLYYLDRVSWLADEGDTLPGRDQRQRIERRHLVNVINNRRR